MLDANYKTVILTHKHFYFAFLLAISIVFSCAVAENSPVHPRATSYLASDIMGDWKLVKVDYVPENQSLELFNYTDSMGLNTEYNPIATVYDGIVTPIWESDVLDTNNRFLRIEMGSAYWMDYPFEIQEKVRYRVRSKTLRIGRKYYNMAVELSRNKDTLKYGYLTHYGLYLEKTYKKVEFDDSVVQILKKHKLNYPMLAGKWILIREAADVSGEYTLNSPYVVPDELVLTREQFIKMMESDFRVYFLTDGIKRMYFLSFDGVEIKLLPDKWFDQEVWKKEHNSPFALYFKRPYLD